jgi:hypothetical protein
MFQQSEAMFQGWRAVAVFKDGREGQLYVGSSTTHFRTGYAATYVELLDAEERAYVSRISLQRWEGAADQGRWVAKSALPVLTCTPGHKRGLSA